MLEIRARQHHDLNTRSAYRGTDLKAISAVLLLFSALLSPAMASTVPIPAQFASKGADRKAIEQLLETYTKAVSTKDQALFETLLLSRDVPFSDVRPAITPGGGAAGTRNYEQFRKGVFEGPAFTQRFRNVRVEQDGPLAQVSLVFVNDAGGRTSWGWKTLHLLKVGGEWKIASEFYTGHPG